MMSTKVNTIEINKSLLVMIEMTLPDLFEKFNNSNEQAIEVVKHMNFIYKLKDSQYQELAAKLRRLSDFCKSKTDGTKYERSDIDDMERLYSGNWNSSDDV